MVTRTLKSTQATLMCVDMETSTIVEKIVTLPRTYADKKAIVKTIEKQNLLPENIRLVDVKSTLIIEAKYGMTEVEFMQYAKPMDIDEADPEVED